VTERCVVKVAFDPATSGTPVRRAVSGFLRYIQHRDLHPAPKPSAQAHAVAGLVKYVAYRDSASSRAELIGPQSSVGSPERKAFVGFVAGSIEGSQPQIFRTRGGLVMDRRRLVSRFLISPESASGLDLQRLTRAAVSRLESEMGVRDLRWIAAIHRNTAHHHVHLVLAGMRVNGIGGFSRVDITKPRLAAMKEAIALEIERQRAERTPSLNAIELPKPVAVPRPAAPSSHEVEPTRAPQQVDLRTSRWRDDRSPRLLPLPLTASVIALRAVAHRYQRQMQRELEEGYQQGQREFAA
jgi:hypothetical protein